MAKETIEEKLVQELAKRGGDPPSRFLQKEGNRPTGPCPPAAGIPVVDLSRLFDSDSGEMAFQINTALRTWGIFHVVSDDMPASLLDEVRSVAREFFYLTKEEKLKYKNQTDDGEFKLEGYGNDIVVTEDQLRDWNDRLYLLMHPENKRNVELWPDNPSSFRSILHEFNNKSRKIANNILMAMAKLLELEEDYFSDQLGEDCTAYARFNYYPGCSKHDAVIGMKPHSDASILTLLLTDKDVEGLQVLKDGEWFTVPIVPNALLVNMGDQMEILTNGIFKSPMHRVVTNPQERISVVMFYAPNSEKYIEPADIFVNEGRPKLYKKMMVKEYIESLFETFAQGKRALDFAKI